MVVFMPRPYLIPPLSSMVPIWCKTTSIFRTKKTEVINIIAGYNPEFHRLNEVVEKKGVHKDTYMEVVEDFREDFNLQNNG